MAQRTLTTRIVIRNDTANNWVANNTKVLLKGEVGFETDTGKYKIGDGSSTWENLPYYSHITSGKATSLDTLIQMLNDDEFGKVDDVKVNNVSVLDSETKTANVVIAGITYTAEKQENVSRETIAGIENITLHKVAKTGSYADLVDKLNIIDNLNSTSTTDVLSANQGNVLKQMVQAIPTATSYATISAMITALNAATGDDFNVGTNLFVQALNVPDFWVYSKEETSVPYTYVDDATFISAVQAGAVQVGYFKVSLLETAKVDLTNYYTKSEVDNLIANIDLSNYVLKSVTNNGITTNIQNNGDEGFRAVTGGTGYVVRFDTDPEGGNANMTAETNEHVAMIAVSTTGTAGILVDETASVLVTANDVRMSTENGGVLVNAAGNLTATGTSFTYNTNNVLTDGDTLILNGGTSEV